jgi:hypothetical protein
LVTRDCKHFGCRGKNAKNQQRERFMNRAQEVVVLAAVGVIGVMVVVPPWNATQPKGDFTKIPVVEKGPAVYHSIFLNPPKIYRNGHEYIPEVDKGRLAAQCGTTIVLAGLLMFVLKSKKEQDEWPLRNSKNMPWDAGQGQNTAE